MLIVRAFCALAVVCSSTSCAADPEVAIADVSGEYVYTPGEQPEPRFAGFLKLNPDGTGVEIRSVKGSAELSTKLTHWTFDRTNRDPTVIVADRAYPVERGGKRLLLLINADLDLYYEKVR